MEGGFGCELHGKRPRCWTFRSTMGSLLESLERRIGGGRVGEEEGLGRGTIIADWKGRERRRVGLRKEQSGDVVSGVVRREERNQRVA